MKAMTNRLTCSLSEIITIPFEIIQVIYVLRPVTLRARSIDPIPTWSDD